jgi:plasmid maintenance system antidote protein VapI
VPIAALSPAEIAIVRLVEVQGTFLANQPAPLADSGETEYAIAKGLGVSQSVVNRFVHGERSIGIDTAARLCAYLKLDLKRRR